MPAMPAIRCHFCNEPIDPNAENNYRRITGWVRNRRRGVNAVFLPGPATGFACGICIDLKAGRGPDQTGTLF